MLESVHSIKKEEKVFKSERNIEYRARGNTMRKIKEITAGQRLCRFVKDMEQDVCVFTSVDKRKMLLKGWF